jgi:thiamine-phosphate pyrophosphorylase
MAIMAISVGLLLHRLQWDLLVMTTLMILPRLYPIVDYSCFAAAADPISAIARFASDLIAAGATLIQYRDKSPNVVRFLSVARELRRLTQDRATLIVNDRLDICLAAGADGVHLGQEDVSPKTARLVFDEAVRNLPANPLLIGYSTHNLQQVEEAGSLPIDYLAVGPVFATASKANPDPVIGLEGVRRARAATAKPLVAIGGITRSTCLQVRDAGADAVAVISDLMESPVKAVEEFLRILR